MQTTLFCMKTPTPKDPKKPYRNFYPTRRTVQLCGTDPVVQVSVSEAPDARDEDCYWGWWDNDKQHFSFVYSWAGAVEMCFPGGTERMTSLGYGRLCKVLVTEDTSC